ncbi:MAG: hypothetical protein IT480_02310 [Gammaproteobacteria bacterium]|nr:hypothetical protein [Gammaproteobacteria bacterium]
MLRSLLQPLAPTVLMLAGIVAALLSVLEQIPLLGLPGLVLLASLVSKYAFVLLESAANGVTDPPPLSIEMANPVEMRPLIQLLIGLLLIMLIGSLRGMAAATAAAVALFLLPASIGVLGVTARPLEALNPLVLLRTIRALGSRYLAILLVASLYAMSVAWAFRVPWWAPLRWALLLFCLLSLCTFIGGAFHARRLQLGFEPIHSPERTAARQAAAQQHCSDHWLEDLYGSVRLQDYTRAGALLVQWSANTGDADAVREAPIIVQRALSWSTERGLALIASRLAARLMRARNPAAALDVVAAALPHAPMLRLVSDTEQFALAQAARADGRRRLAVALLQHFGRDFPDSPLAARAREWCDQLDDRRP